MKRRLFGLFAISLFPAMVAPAHAADEGAPRETGYTFPHVEVQAGYSRSWLSGGREEWNAFHTEALVHLEPKEVRPSGRKFLAARYYETQRFGLWDREFALGLSHPIDRKTTGRIEAGSSPSYHYLPKFQVLAGASHVVASGWVGHLDYRHTDYRPNAVDQISAGTDKYFASFRAGYTFSWSAIPGEEGVIGNRLVFEHYLDPEAQNRIAIALAAGQELENTQGQVVKTRVHSVWLYGRQPVNPRVSIVWQMAFGAHSSYVQREAGLAFRTSF